MKKLAALAIAGVLATPVAAIERESGGFEAASVKKSAFGPRSASGQSRGLSWTATSSIIGTTPTSSVPLPGSGGGGNPLFFPSGNKAGTVALIMEYADGAFICSGSLMAGGMSVLTAAHCVSSGAGTANPLRTTAYFYNGDPNARTPFNPGVRAVEISRYMVDPDYTGEVIDQNDVAVLRLVSAVTDVEGYELYEGPLQGEQFNVAGYGGRSSIGSAFGVDSRTGFLREGDNIFDYSWGNAAFDGFFTDRDENGENFFGFAEVDQSWISDLDNGLAVNDTACRIAAAVGAPAGFGCNTGIGPREVGVAGGDSGGPQFIDGRIASVTSYGLSFGLAFGDCRNGLNSSCGEFSGYAPVAPNIDFIRAAAAVPEPGTWAMMIIGFGAVGFASRRRNAVAA